MNGKLWTVAMLAGVLGFGGAYAQEEEETMPLESVLTGAQEVPPVESPGTGQFTMEFDAGFDQATYTLNVLGLESAITGAHLHCAAAGENGPIVLPLDVEAIGGEESAAQETTVTSDDVTPPDQDACDVPVNNLASLYAAILAGKVYANVHTDTNPEGELRGQIFVVKEGVSQAAETPDEGTEQP